MDNTKKQRKKKIKKVKGLKTNPTFQPLRVDNIAVDSTNTESGITNHEQPIFAPIVVPTDEDLDHMEKGNISVKDHQAALQALDAKNNTYATTKSVSQITLNTSVIQAQIYMLVLILADAQSNGFKISLLVLIPVALILEFAIYVMLITLALTDTEQVTKKITATRLNGWTTSLSGLLLIITSAITIISWKAGIGSTLPPNITNTR